MCLSKQKGMSLGSNSCRVTAQKTTTAQLHEAAAAPAQTLGNYSLRVPLKPTNAAHMAVVKVELENVEKQ